MEALVCWYVEMYGESRWYPEHKEDESNRDAGNKSERRGKRTGGGENEKRKQAPQMFAKYWKFVQERRSASDDWERAIQDAAKEENSTTASKEGTAESETTQTDQARKRPRKKVAEPVIAAQYRFTEDGQMVPMENVQLTEV